MAKEEALALDGIVSDVLPSAMFRVSLDTNVAEQWSPASAARELAQKMDFDSYQQIANTVALVDREGLQFGRQIAGAVLFWVPRSLWSDKPLSTGEYVGEQTGHAFTNLSAPLWMEFYIDGGLLLVFLGFLGYGLVVRTLDEWNQWSKGHGGARVVSLLVPVYAGYQFFLLRGSLMPAIAYLTPIVIFAVICSLPIPLPSKGWLRGGLTARRPERIC